LYPARAVSWASVQRKHHKRHVVAEVLDLKLVLILLIGTDPVFMELRIAAVPSNLPIPADERSQTASGAKKLIIASKSRRTKASFGSRQRSTGSGVVDSSGMG
jgi:hypothetical protein